MTSTRWCLPVTYLLPAGPTPFLKPKRGAVLGGPVRARRRSSMTNGMRSFMLARRHRREQVGRHPGHVEVAVGRNAIVLHGVAPLLPELCALAGRFGQGSGFDSQREAAMGKMTGRVGDRHRCQPRHRPGDRRAVRRRGRQGGLRGAHPERGRPSAQGLARQHRGRHPGGGRRGDGGRRRHLVRSRVPAGWSRRRAPPMAGSTPW